MASTAKRYAKAVFELAHADGDVDAWRGRLSRLQQLFADSKVEGIVANPAISPERRTGMLDVLDDGTLGQEGRNLGKLLVEARATAAIGQLREEYDRLDDQAQGRVRGVVTTAVPLAAQDRERLEADLSRRFGAEVRLEARLDPRILGGLVLQVGDRLIDASVQSRLQQLRRQLKTA